MISRNFRLTEYRGLSTDTKPQDAENGAEFREIDNGKKFYFDGENKAWFEVTNTTKEEVTLCLYNGVELPPLPEYDKTVYPYAALCTVNSSISMLFLSGGLPYVKEGSLYFPAPVVVCENRSKPYFWDSFDELEGDYKGFSPVSLIWCNFDYYNDDGSLLLAGSEATPTNVPYVIETLFDGEVTTVANDDGTSYLSEVICSLDSFFSSLCAYRVTLNGETIVSDRLTNNLIGNGFLYSSSSYEDNGLSWCILSQYKFSQKVYNVTLYTREPGTYQVKFESVRG